MKYLVLGLLIYAVGSELRAWLWKGTARMLLKERNDWQAAAAIWQHAADQWESNAWSAAEQLDQHESIWLN